MSDENRQHAALVPFWERLLVTAVAIFVAMNVARVAEESAASLGRWGSFAVGILAGTATAAALITLLTSLRRGRRRDG